MVTTHSNKFYMSMLHAFTELIYIPYSGKISKGLIFENFESSQAFLKIFF